jgi:hypothetical protein
MLLLHLALELILLFVEAVLYVIIVLIDALLLLCIVICQNSFSLVCFKSKLSNESLKLFLDGACRHNSLTH